MGLLHFYTSVAQYVSNDRASSCGRLSPPGKKANKSVQFYGQSINDSCHLKYIAELV